MRRAGLLLCLLLAACMPSTPELLLTEQCQSEASTAELLGSHWLLGQNTWRLQQTALLEIGHRKMALQGFLRLDLEAEEARLVALNELGLVLFDLTVSKDGEQLQQALPQLAKIDGFASGIGRSLRQIFLAPGPQKDDRLRRETHGTRLARQVNGSPFSSLFDCNGDLRETRLAVGNKGWRVLYNRYRNRGPARIPDEIILNDYRYGIKLSLAVTEVRPEP